MNDWGRTCAKDIIDRGFGIPMTCDPLTEIADGLVCHTPCKYRTVGLGPTCVGQCPNGTFKCAEVLCLSFTEDCSKKTVSLILSIVGSLNESADSSELVDVSGLMEEFDYPQCPSYY